MTRPDPALVAEVMAERLPFLLATIATVQTALAQSERDSKPSPVKRKAA